MSGTKRLPQGATHHSDHCNVDIDWIAVHPTEYWALTTLGSEHGLSPFDILAGALIGFGAEWNGTDEVVVHMCWDEPVRSVIRLEPNLSVIDLGRAVPKQAVTTMADTAAGPNAPVARALRVDILPKASIVVDPAEPGRVHCECAEDASQGFCVTGRFMEAFWRYLKGASHSATAPRRTVPLVPPDEANALIELGHGPTAAYPAGATTAELIYAAARQTPDSTAIELGESSMTYSDLCQTADRILEDLRRTGVPRDGLIGLAMTRDQLLVPSILAIWQAACAYVPVDPAMPVVRLERMLEDLRSSGMEWLLADQRTAEELGSHIEDQIPMAAFPNNMICRLSGAEPRTAPSTLPGMAYVLFTSGSTGRPKGTMVSHRNVLAFIHGIERAIGGGAEEVVLATTSLTFDISVLEIFWPLANGRRIRLLDTIGHVRGDELSVVLRSPGPKLLQVTPSTASLVAFPPGPNELRIAVGGEALPAATAVLLRGRCKQLYNLYGPTETTVWVTYQEVVEVGDGSPATVGIGRPLPNCGVIVLDAHGRIVPFGMDGELHVYGPQVTAGYLVDPGSDGPYYSSELLDGARVYRTGDRVRWRVDNTLEFRGRVDDQIKISGNRVELGEVESALLDHPSVVQAAVVARTKGQGTALHGFIRIAAASPAAQSSESTVVRDWVRVFDDEFAPKLTSGDPSSDLAFWRSDVDGSALDSTQMLDWYRALASLLGRLEATHVLDVGCGTGALLRQLVDQVERYVGLEPSANAITRLRSVAGASRKVSFVHADAQALGDTNVVAAVNAALGHAGRPGRPDAIVLNSVVQYFPSLSYLAKVLDSAADLLPDQGHIVVADVRSLPMLPAYTAWLATMRNAVLPIEPVRSELVIDPAFFVQWANGNLHSWRVWITPRIVRIGNELSQFRFDVVISKGDPPARPYELVDYHSIGGTPEVLAGYLRSTGLGRSIAVTGIPNRDLARADPTSASGGMSAFELHQVLADVPGVAVGFDPFGLDRGLLLAARTDGASLDWTAIGTRRRPLVLAVEPSWNQSFATLRRTFWHLLSQRLPVNMLPAAVSVIDEFPLTMSGKIDRTLLASAPLIDAQMIRPPAIPATPPTVDASLVADRRDADLQRVATMMSDLLGVPVGPTDDFVHAGGSSLDAARLAKLLWDGMQWDLRPGEVVRLRSARAICEAGRSTITRPSTRSEQQGQSPPSLSLAQRSMVAMSYLHPDSAGRLNVSIRWELSGPINMKRLVAAVRHVVQRHPILRSVVSGSGEVLVLPVSQALESIAGEHVDPTRSFDLSREAPVRWALRSFAMGDAELRAVFHHLAIDDAAIYTINDSLIAAYAGLERDAEPLEARYIEALLAERRLYHRHAMAARSYWSHLGQDFHGAERSPFTKPTRTRDPRCVRLSRTVSRGVARINESARAADVTPFVYLLSAVAWSVGIELSTNRVVAAIPVSSREAAGAEELLGCYANLVPVSVPIHATEPGRIVAEASRATLAALDHGILPFAEICRLVRLPRNEAGEPALAFVCQMEEMPGPRTVDATTFTVVLDPPRLPMYPLIIRGETKNGLFTIHADVDQSRIRLDEAEEILARVTNIVDSGTWSGPETG